MYSLLVTGLVLSLGSPAQAWLDLQALDSHKKEFMSESKGELKKFYLGGEKEGSWRQDQGLSPGLAAAWPPWPQVSQHPT